MTKEPLNVGQKAHIYSFSSNGPRGNTGVPVEDLNGIANLILVCTECHLKIDDEPDGGRYSAAVLQQMKARHEQRIEIVGGIEPSRASHVLQYFANIGEHSPIASMADAGTAMFPLRYPAAERPIELGLSNSASQDSLEEFWAGEAHQLRTQFERHVRTRIAARDIEHLSVFALAPQPLLVLLGTLLGDIIPADVFQRHREPPTWSWPSIASTPDFLVEEPRSKEGTPALVFALSATVLNMRIADALGPDPSVWTVTVGAPHNDLTKSREQIAQFREVTRATLDRIKAAHGQSTTLHVFLAMGTAMAVELGRVRMPKADMSWELYDQVNARGGFVRALSISTETADDSN